MGLVARSELWIAVWVESVLVETPGMYVILHRPYMGHYHGIVAELAICPGPCGSFNDFYRHIVLRSGSYRILQLATDIMFCLVWTSAE